MTEPRPFLTAMWRDLAFINVEADPMALQPWLPPGTELDYFEGRTFLSLVGFRFSGTRVLGVPVPLHRDFEEVNLRFYVRFLGPDGWRRGVAFIRELVPRRAIAGIARWKYNEPYLAVPMSSEISNEYPGQAAYRWRAEGAWMGIRMEVERDAEATPEASFIAEHFWGYGRSKDGRLIQYRVEHPAWHLRKARLMDFEGPVASFYGAPFEDMLSGPIRSVFFAEGSEVSVSRPEVI